MSDRLQTPVVLILFRRPEPTRQVWAKIRAARPEKLFLIADGPRNAAERESCAAARAVTETVDWPCDVRRNFSDANLGCRERVFSGLDWVFEQAEEAIILEDDCVPDPSFFPFCAELLARYRDDPRVTTIGANNFQAGRKFGPASYYFSAHAHIWGWATWRRAWQRCDKSMAGWPEFKARGRMREFFATAEAVAFWTGILDRAHRGEWKGAWDHAWWFSQLAQGGCGVCPQTNLVANIGFGADATHTSEAKENFPPPAAPLSFPLQHPPRVAIASAADRAYFEANFGSKSPRGAFAFVRHSVLPRLPGASLLRVVAKKLRATESWKRLRNPAYRKRQRELDRLRRLAGTPGSTPLLGQPVTFTDGGVFHTLYEEIFIKEMYHFARSAPRPRIVDCGANVGLAVLYWKSLYPDSRIVAFEPDPGAFSCLKKNVAAWSLADVELNEAAVWTEDGTVSFDARGGAAGRIAGMHSAGETKRGVAATRLSRILDQPTAMLKIDIEGAELDVLREAADRLGHVENIYVEFHSFVGERQKLSELLGILEAKRFRYIVESNVSRSRPFTSPRNWEGIDMALHIFAQRT
ncbi:MAG TPA: FkbM family methyltransferase [Opitutaceae bacterium]|nr:FkbM family methyltransferase [Opitutaceae bacterium]